MEARLSGPRRGKDKVMADENIEEVSLTPEDIPGPAVENAEIGKLTVNQLKFCLKCQRINQTENRKVSIVMLRVLLLHSVLVAIGNLSVYFFYMVKNLIPCQ